MCVCVVGVAFLALLERRFLGSIHICRGPNKVGFFSILEMLLELEFCLLFCMGVKLGR